MLSGAAPADTEPADPGCDLCEGLVVPCLPTRVDIFLREHSEVVKAAIADDPAATAAASLFIATDHLSVERSAQLVDLLAKLHAEMLSPFRICHIRSTPLYDSLAGCTSADSDAMRFLVDYLQLPRSLLLRLTQQAAAQGQLGLGASGLVHGAPRLLDALRSMEPLRPLLEFAAAAAVVERMPHVPGFPVQLAMDEAFLEGLCGDPCVPRPLLHRKVGKAIAVHVAGRLAAQHPLPSEHITDTVKRCMLPGAVVSKLGRMEQLQMLYADGWLLDTGACAAAAAGGHTDVLAWLRTEAHAKWSADTTACAIVGGHLDALIWAAAHGCAVPEESCVLAAGSGHMPVLRWLVGELRRPWRQMDVLCCAHAAERGDLPMLEFLHSCGCPSNARTAEAAARQGRLDVLRWLHERAYPFTANTCAQAAAGGHLAALQWLRTQDPPCPWDKWTCAAAARNGDLEILQWARSQRPPCPWDSCVITVALKHHPEVAEWARASGCPIPVSH